MVSFQLFVLLEPRWPRCYLVMPPMMTFTPLTQRLISSRNILTEAASSLLSHGLFKLTHKINHHKKYFCRFLKAEVRFGNSFIFHREVLSLCNDRSSYTRLTFPKNIKNNCLKVSERERKERKRESNQRQTKQGEI